MRSKIEGLEWSFCQAKFLLYILWTLNFSLLSFSTSDLKGRAAVDNEFPGKTGGVPRQFNAADYHVLDEKGTVSDCMMNQTEISQNANKVNA